MDLPAPVPQKHHSSPSLPKLLDGGRQTAKCGTFLFESTPGTGVRAKFFHITEVFVEATVAGDEVLSRSVVVSVVDEESVYLNDVSI